MSRHHKIDRICYAIVGLTLVLCILFMCGAGLGIEAAERTIGYKDRFFDNSRVHTIDIVMENWEDFLKTCTNEEYSACSVVVDGEAYKNVGIRAKGNTSLSSVAAYGNNRYSFKLEFDQYEVGGSYYGLDKISLNNLVQDNTYLKDYLSYTMMADMGVAAPLCSFVFITVNGEDWGMYLAVEAVEESFLMRNYGTDYGVLYKPDSLGFGGGRGNGMDFNIETVLEENPELDESDGFFKSVPGGIKDNGMESHDRGGMAGGITGSQDIMLQYIDDMPSSYSNIFDNAKTKITEADQQRLIASLKTLSEGNAADVVDVEAVIRYFVVHNFVCNGDSYTGSLVHNYYLYEKDGVMSMIPWDYNLAFGGFSVGSDMSTDATSQINAPIDSPVSSGDLSSRPMVAWIFSNEEYIQLYHKTYQEFLDRYFTSGYFDVLLDEVSGMISSYVEKDPTAFCSYTEFQSGMQALRQFCTLRARSVQGQLDGDIPSTYEGQNMQNATLIDASDLELSAMGDMNSTGGMNGAHDLPGSIPTPGKDIPEDGDANNAPADGMPWGGGFGMEKGTGPGRSISSAALENTAPGQMPDGMPANIPVADSAAGESPLQMLLVCAAVLLVLAAGLIFARKVRGRHSI